MSHFFDSWMTKAGGEPHLQSDDPDPRPALLDRVLHHQFDPASHGPPDKLQHVTIASAINRHHASIYWIAAHISSLQVLEKSTQKNCCSSSNGMNA